MKVRILLHKNPENQKNPENPEKMTKKYYDTTHKIHHDYLAPFIYQSAIYRYTLN